MTPTTAQEALATALRTSDEHIEGEYDKAAQAILAALPEGWALVNVEDAARRYCEHVTHQTNIWVTKTEAQKADWVAAVSDILGLVQP